MAEEAAAAEVEVEVEVEAVEAVAPLGTSPALRARISSNLSVRTPRSCAVLT